MGQKRGKERGASLRNLVPCGSLGVNEQAREIEGVKNKKNLNNGGFFASVSHWGGKGSSR